MTDAPSQHRRPRAARPGRGFTLLEILTVVIIIAVVMAIGLPMLAKARKAARATQAFGRVELVRLRPGLSRCLLRRRLLHLGIGGSGEDEGQRSCRRPSEN